MTAGELDLRVMTIGPEPEGSQPIFGDLCMPPSKSSKAKAAWARARKYAEQHGVSVKEARTILAKQTEAPAPARSPSPPKSERQTSSAKARTDKPAKVSRPRSVGKASTAKPLDLPAAEAALRKKYPHIVAGTIQIHDDGPHQGRRTVEIACQAEGCDKRRRIHTSDAFQVQLCGECTKAFRQKKRAKTTQKGPA